MILSNRLGVCVFGSNGLLSYSESMGHLRHKLFFSSYCSVSYHCCTLSANTVNPSVPLLLSSTADLPRDSQLPAVLHVFGCEAARAPGSASPVPVVPAYFSALKLFCFLISQSNLSILASLSLRSNNLEELSLRPTKLLLLLPQLLSRFLILSRHQLFLEFQHLCGILCLQPLLGR